MSRRYPDAGRVPVEMLEMTLSRPGPSRSQTRRYGGVHVGELIGGQRPGRAAPSVQIAGEPLGGRRQGRGHRIAGRDRRDIVCRSIRNTSHVPRSIYPRGYRPRWAGMTDQRPRRRVAFAPRRYRWRQGAHRTGAAPQRQPPPARWPATPCGADAAPTVGPPPRPWRSPRLGGPGTRAPCHVAAEAAPVIDRGRASRAQCRLPVRRRVKRLGGRPAPQPADHR